MTCRDIMYKEFQVFRIMGQHREDRDMPAYRNSDGFADVL